MGVAQVGQRRDALAALQQRLHVGQLRTVLAIADHQLPGRGRLDARLELLQRHRDIVVLAELPQRRIADRGEQEEGRGQCRLRGGIGSAREGMHFGAGDRRHVDHGALRGLQFLQQSARQHDGGEEVDLEHRLPVMLAGLERIHPSATCKLGADGGVVHQCIQLRAVRLQLFPHERDRLVRVLGRGEVNDDVILWARIPRAILGERLARTGDDAPSRRREALHGGVPDATGGAGQNQGLAGVSHGSRI